MSDQYKKNYISRCLAFAGVDVFWRQKLETHGGILYTNFGIKKIGGEMTKLTFPPYPIKETLGKNILKKRLKFKSY